MSSDDAPTRSTRSPSRCSRTRSSRSVDQMAEQILRTCHSFVIYARDFSSALCDREGNTIMQGSQDIAVHVGTLHFTCKAVIEAFGDDIHPGDVFAINDPYLGGTHFNDVRDHPADLPRGRGHRLRAVQRPLGRHGRQRARLVRHHREGPLRRGPAHPARPDLGRGPLPATTSCGMIVSNTRAPDDAEGDLHAQAEATRGGRAGDPAAGREVRPRHDRRRRSARCRTTSSGSRASASPSCPTARGRPRTTSTPIPAAGEGLVPIKVKLTIEGDQIHYDLSGSHPAVGTFLNCGVRRDASRASSAGTKTFFPDVPLNSGFYRAVDVDLGPEGIGRQRAVAGRGHRLLLRALREDHERDLRDLVADHARAGDRLLASTSSTCSSAGATRARDERPYLHVVRLDGRRLGRAQRQGRLQLHLAGLRRRARGAAARGPGAPLPGASRRGHEILHRLRRAGAVPRRLRRREGRRR